MNKISLLLITKQSRYNFSFLTIMCYFEIQIEKYFLLDFEHPEDKKMSKEYICLLIYFFKTRGELSKK